MCYGYSARGKGNIGNHSYNQLNDKEVSDYEAYLELKKLTLLQYMQHEVYHEY